MTRIAGLTGATLPTAPTVCHECIFWQSRTGRSVDKRRWIRGTEEEWGAWGTVYYDDDGRLLGSMQYGPSDLFPRAAELPAGPPSEDSVLVTSYCDATGRGSVRRVWLDGQTRVIASGAWEPRGVASDGERVFVAVRRTGRVLVFPLYF